MKIKTYGYSGYTGQVSRINEGLVSLGHSLVENPEEADLIYVNDRTFENFEILSKCRGKKILNVLDVPRRHLSNQKIEEWRRVLSCADVVTCISETVAKDVKSILGFNSKVIYNPVKDVRCEPEAGKAISQRFLYVGRANDPNKRFHLVKDFISSLKDHPVQSLAVCGSEDPRFGSYYGVVKDEDLNRIYNSVDIVLLPSFQEGIGLSMIEAIICRKFPICCLDNDTAREFLPEQFLCDPNVKSISEKAEDYLTNRNKYDSIILEMSNDYQEKFSKVSIARNIQKLIQL